MKLTRTPLRWGSASRRLHTGSFADLPFSDAVFSLVTASLSIHNADKDTRKKAIKEAARVLVSGGCLVGVDMAGYVGEYVNTVKEMGWMDVSSEFAGLRIMYGAWLCQILRTRKP